MRSVLLALLLGATPALAHDQWADGTRVPDWVKRSCCGPEDVHHLTPEQVHKVDGGYRIDGWPYVIPDDHVLPSQDGDYWAFYDLHWRGAQGNPTMFCFFVPLSM
jgi:hypothetical protein